MGMRRSGDRRDEPCPQMALQVGEAGETKRLSRSGDGGFADPDRFGQLWRGDDGAIARVGHQPIDRPTLTGRELVVIRRRWRDQSRTPVPGWR